MPGLYKKKGIGTDIEETLSHRNNNDESGLQFIKIDFLTGDQEVELAIFVKF